MIILTYPTYVGGKFIANCLALSRHCVVQQEQLASIDLKFTKFDQTYYDFKFKSVLKSLPPRDQMTNWLGFEFGCDKLYGIHEDFYKNNDINTIRQTVAENRMITKIREHNRLGCKITHDYRTLMKEIIIYPTAKLIEFKNFDNFRYIAAKLKSKTDPTIEPGYTESKKYHYNDQNFYQLDSYMIDVDNTFMEWFPFNQMMQGLYEYMGFDDYNAELMYKFWVEYTNLHR